METELRVQDSPVPTQMTCGFFGSISTAPIDWTGCLSKTGLNVVPPSWLFHTPPLAAATYKRDLPSTLRPAIAEIRPLIVAEPMLRALSPEITPASATGSGAGPLSGGGCARSGAVFCGGGIARVPGPAGNRNSSSPAWTLPSALSTVNRCVFGPPLRPDSTEVGIQMPLTCAYAPKSVSVTRSEPRILRSLTRRISRK